MNRNQKLDLSFIIVKSPFSENIKLSEWYKQKFFWCKYKMLQIFILLFYINVITIIASFLLKILGT